MDSQKISNSTPLLHIQIILFYFALFLFYPSNNILSPGHAKSLKLNIVPPENY